MTIVSRSLLGPLASLFLLSSVLSGCLGSGDEESVVRVSGSVSASPDASAGQVEANASVNVTYEPPVASFSVAPSNASETNLTAGLDLLFNASGSSDPSEGDLAYAWDFGDNATAEGPVVNHTYAAEGNFTVLLVVTSDVSELSGNFSQVLAILPPPKLGREAVSLKDASGDGRSNYHDLQSITFSDDGVNVTIKLKVAAVQPGSTADTLVLYDIFINKVNLEVYACNNSGYRLFDNTKGARVAGSQVTLTGTEFTIKFPFEYIQDAMPWQVYFQSFTGDGCLAGLEPDDRAPNSGTVSYG